MASNPEETEGGSGGSWLPLVVIIVLLCVRWAAYGQGNTPVRIRRWYNLQRVQWMKRLGYRDGSVYKGGAGQGASQKVKRQG